MSDRIPRRVLIQSINYAPELTGIGKYNGEMAEWLVARGVHVKVVTAPPYYPAWRIAQPYSAWRYQCETHNGVEIIRCPLWVPRKVTGLRRIIHLASFALTALPVMLYLGFRWRPDVVLTIEPPLFAAPGALATSRLSGARSWLHVQDFEMDAAFELGILRLPGARRMVLAIERWLMRRFTKVSTISDRMLERLVVKGVPVERQVLLPNWVELDRVYPLPNTSPFRSEWNLNGAQAIVLYAGNMGLKQDLDIVIAAANRLRNNNIHFVLCGDGAARGHVEKAASNLDNVLLRPLVPAERLNDLLNLADIHVLPQRANAEDLVLPSKLSNMLASGRPVVATAGQDSQIAKILDKCGVVVPPGDVTRLAEALLMLTNDPIKRKSLGETARRVAEKQWDKNTILTASFAQHITDSDHL